MTNNIYISTLKDSYIILEVKITSDTTIFQNQHIKATNTFVYLEENNDHYRDKTG